MLLLLHPVSATHRTDKLHYGESAAQSTAFLLWPVVASIIAIQPLQPPTDFIIEQSDSPPSLLTVPLAIIVISTTRLLRHFLDTALLLMPLGLKQATGQY